MKKICKNFVTAGLCVALCLTSVPMKGYGAEALEPTEVREEESETLPVPEYVENEENIQREKENGLYVNEEDMQIQPEREKKSTTYVEEEGREYSVYECGNYSFISRDGKAAVIWEYNGEEKTIKVPKTLTAEGKTYVVTAIGSFAFSGEHNALKLPDTIVELEEYAFYNLNVNYIYLPKSIQKIAKKALGNTQYWCWKNSYAYKYLRKNGFSDQDGRLFCLDAPPKVSFFHTKKTGSKEITLSWRKIENVSGYLIVSCNKKGKNQKRVALVSGDKKISQKVKGLKSNQTFYYRICSVNNYQGKTYYGAYSPVLTVRTKPSAKIVSSTDYKLKKGYSAKIAKTSIILPASVVTTYDSERISYVGYSEHGSKSLIQSFHGDWASVSELTNFWDYKGQYNIVCANAKTAYILRYKNNFKKRSILKIKKKYPLLGDVVCDKKGNYYIIWGKEDKSGKGNYVTIAVSKYTYFGKHVKTVTYKTATSRNQANYWDTRVPFEAGNCSTVITNNVLVCLYSRKMYNGHQSSDVIAVNISNMKKNTEYTTYTSHSFDQRVIALKDGGVCYADHGDAYPRGFHISFSKSDTYEEQTPFHFYGTLGANDTNAWLGGVCETSTGVFLSGAAPKSMSDKSRNQCKNLFIQLVDRERKISGSKKRKGTSGGETCIDTGVKWLTNYSSKYDIANPKMVRIDDGRIVLLWEKFKGAEFVQSYYMVLSSDGSVLQKATPMNGTRLASFEEPLYKSGKIYWITAGRMESFAKEIGNGYRRAEGRKATVNCLTIGVLVKK